MRFLEYVRILVGLPARPSDPATPKASGSCTYAVAEELRAPLHEKLEPEPNQERHEDPYPKLEPQPSMFPIIGGRNPLMTGRTSASHPPSPTMPPLYQDPARRAAARAALRVEPGELAECPRCGQLVQPSALWWREAELTYPLGGRRIYIESGHDCG